MKNLFYLSTILIFCISISSCKKNFDSDDLTELEEIISENDNTFPEFYYKGTIEDLVNMVEVPFSRETIVTEGNFAPFIGSASGQGTQSDNDYKFAISSTGNKVHSITSSAGPNDEDIVLFVGNEIIAKIVTELEGDEWYIRFSKEELESFLIEGNVLSFGILPGQVEITFHHSRINGFPQFSERDYIGFSRFSEDTSNDTFEILKVEDYVSTTNDDRGLTVTAKINCTLMGFSIEEEMKLKDVEATFLFLHN